MRAVIQRTTKAGVSINGVTVAKIDIGLVVFLGIEESDTDEDIDFLCRKIDGLRIFSDSEGKMNLNIQDVKGSFLVVSQFTLHAKTKKGNRPSFVRAAKPETAIVIYQKFLEKLFTISNIEVKSGEFGANMKVSIINDGPVTLIIDTKNKE